MLLRLGKKGISGLILVAFAAGAGTLPAVATQSPAKSSQSTTASAAGQSAKPKGKSSRRRRGRRVKGQKAPTADRISAIQEALARTGALKGTPTGKWDDSTIEAMKKFQASKGLSPTGKLDAPTLQKLGLGSEIAGHGAPTPPPNSTNRLRNSPSLYAEPEPDSESDPHN